MEVFVLPDPALSAQAAAALQLLLDLCALDSGSGHEAALLPALVPALERRGAQVELQAFAPGRVNVLATWGEPELLFSTHLDTVPPFIAPRWDGTGIHGRGSNDAKGQMVAQLLAVDQLLARGRSGLAWLGVAGEETDSLGAQAALAWKDRFSRCRALINGEPTELLLAAGQRGVEHLVLACAGIPAHGGSPELGHSAILDLLDWLQRVRQLPLGADPELGPEVWNLGRILGGEAVNIVAAHAEAHLNVRTVPGSSFRAQVEACRPETGSLRVQLAEPPCQYPALPGFQRAPMPFGSDAPQLRALIPSGMVVLAGPGSIRSAHTEHEHLAMADLLAGIDLNFRLALHFLESNP